MISFVPQGTRATPHKRHRTFRSCQECRRRKTKCDRKEPCSHCILSKAQCNYSGETVQTTAHSDGFSQSNPTGFFSTAPPTPRASDTAANQSRTSQIPIGSPIRSHEIVTDDIVQSSRHAFIPALNAQHELDELRSRVNSLEQLISRHGIENAPGSLGNLAPDPPDDPGINDISRSLQDGRVELNKSRLYGQSHWTSATQQFQNTALLLNSEAGSVTNDEGIGTLMAEIGTLLRKCKYLAKSIKSSRPSRLFALPEPICRAELKNLADYLAQLYISRFESTFRILHIPTFWVEYGQYWQNLSEADILTQLKVQLVLAIGTSLYGESSEKVGVCSSARQWVYAAQDWLSAPMEKDRLSISGLQIQCLLILARQVLAVSGDLIWIAMGTLVRTAMQMGLHRDPKHLAKVSTMQGEIRRRLWVTILELNIQASLDSGVPPTLSLEDFDTEPPSNINDSDINESTETLEHCPDTTFTDTSLQRFLFRCMRSRIEILRRMNGVGWDIAYEEVPALTSKLNNACREISNHVITDTETKGKAFQHNLADLLIRRFLLSLHRPFASRARDNPSYYFSRKICFDSAMALLSPPSDDEFSYLVLLGSGIFKNRIIHISLALASELVIETEKQGINSSMQGASGYKKLLVDGVKEACWQLAQRMQLGETNVRLHMKLSMILSQTESNGEDGASLQHKIAQSARDSLQMSYSTIQARSASSAVWSQGSENMLTPQEFDQQSISSSFDFNDILQTTDFMDDTFGFASFLG